MKALNIITGYDNFIGQTRKPWVSIDTDMFLAELQNQGVSPKLYQMHQLINGLETLRDSVIFYTFSHRANLRSYFHDGLIWLESMGNKLIPSIDLFLCHENKGWQELYKHKKGYDGLKCFYFSSKRELDAVDLKYPLVFKTLNGSNSSGVALVHNKAELLRTIINREKKLSFLEKTDLIRRKYLRKYKKFPGYPNYDSRYDAKLYEDYIKPEIPFILQEFVPGLSCDYRVVRLGERAFISKRMTRKGDFRASGGGHFDFMPKEPERILQKAKEIYETFDSPYLSMDLAEDSKGNIHILEFQAQHFGVNTIIRSKGFYVNEGGAWVFRERKALLEQYLAQGMAHYLNQRWSSLTTS